MRNGKCGQEGVAAAPWISVVTVSYDQGRFIRDNIESVLRQGLAGVEHVVIDGGSTDETVDILKEYSHLRWVSEEDRGQTDALNKGLEMARGEWIAWVNSDDYLEPHAFAALRAFLDGRPDASFVYSNALYVDSDGKETERVKATYTRDGFLHWWRAGAGFVQTGTFFRRELWERFGPFDVDLEYSMDYDFWLRISDEVEFDYLDDYLVAYRLHEASKTGQGQANFARELVRVCQRHWDRKGGWTKWRFRVLLRLAYGQTLVFDGIRFWEEGLRGKAIRSLFPGYVRNPLSFFSQPHLCFLLRRAIGTRLYEKARARYRSATCAKGPPTPETGTSPEQNEPRRDDRD